MTRNVVVFSLGDTPGEVLRILTAQQHSGGPVTNPRGQVVGMITAWDFIAETFPDLIALMTRAVRTLHSDDQLSTAAEIMQREGFNHIPIVDQDHQLKGIVTDQDLFRPIRPVVAEEPIPISSMDLQPLQVVPATEVLPPPRRMTMGDRDHLLVMDGTRPEGLVTDGRYVRALVNEDMTGLRSDTRPSSEVMASPVQYVDPGASSLQALDKMISAEVRQLPVVSDQGEVLGLLRGRDLVAHYCCD